MIDRIEVEEIIGGVLVVTGMCEVGIGYWVVGSITSIVTTLGFS